MVAKALQRKEGSLIKKIQQFVLKSKDIFVGLEDSKKSWKVYVRSGRLVVHETSMPVEYKNLRNYFRRTAAPVWRKNTAGCERRR